VQFGGEIEVIDYVALHHLNIPQQAIHRVIEGVDAGSRRLATNSHGLNALLDSYRDFGAQADAFGSLFRLINLSYFEILAGAGTDRAFGRARQ
jgi:hypothetical protein